MISWKDYGDLYIGSLNNKRVSVISKSGSMWRASGIINGTDRDKDRLIESINTTLNEYALGAGFSMSGGQSIYPGGMRGGRINRGGFNTSLYGGGDNSMYTYDIVPLTRKLEQPESSFNDNWDKISMYPGETVRGKMVNDRSDEWITGELVSVIKSQDGTVLYLIVQDEKDNIRKNIDPTTVSTYTKLHSIENKDLYSEDDLAMQSKNANDDKLVKEGINSYSDNDILVESDNDVILSLPELRKKYKMAHITMKMKKPGLYFVKVDIRTQGDKIEPLGKLKGLVRKEEGIKFLNKILSKKYDGYY